MLLVNDPRYQLERRADGSYWDRIDSAKTHNLPDMWVDFACPTVALDLAAMCFMSEQYTDEFTAWLRGEDKP
jgi:hypothetical protein